MTTERGAYTLDGATSGGLSITRNPGAKYSIPSENEWYKAAFHQPAGQSGDGDDYWIYSTRSNTAPNAEAPPGGSNSANYSSAGLTEGGAYSSSSGFYGTFDQGGNVWEWNEAVIGPRRGMRGGSWANLEDGLRASNRSEENPHEDFATVGFRVASP